MTSTQIVNEFFARKGGIEWADVPLPGGGTRQASQIICITIKQANWLQSVAQREGCARIDYHGRTIGDLGDSEWMLGFPRKNSRQKAANLQIVKK